MGHMDSLDIRVYLRLADALELEPDLSARLGVALCPECGDIHLTSQLCRNLCAVELDDDGNEETEGIK